MYNKTSLFIFIFGLCFFVVSIPLYAQTQVLTTGIRNITSVGQAPNAKEYDDFVTITSIHNTLDYYFYNKFFAVHLFGAFPSFYERAIPSNSLLLDEPLYRNKSNEAYKSTAFGIGIAPSLTKKISNFEFQANIGPTFLFHHYQFFFLDNNNVPINDTKNAYFVPLNIRNYGIGMEGNFTISYFFDNNFGMTAMLTGGYYQIYNPKKLPENTIVDIVDSASIDNKNLGTYAFSLGMAYRH